MGYDIRDANGKVVEGIHMSTGHGRVLYIDFKDRTQLVLWAFDEPDRLQAVLWDPDTKEVIRDMRTDACQEYTKMVFEKLANRTPPVLYDTPFKTYHRSNFVPN